MLRYNEIIYILFITRHYECALLPSFPCPSQLHKDQLSYSTSTKILQFVKELLRMTQYEYADVHLSACDVEGS